ncbi:MAG TPA: PQQ-dependent sugar dehydrogenase [Patescibacteria group bacterium]|nr:PQQ-dependent sugar dehydrogenase [Patescibacteria group bacterium]
MALQVVAEGLAAPIGIAPGPPGWLLVQEQEGRVMAVALASGEVSVALDITDRVLGGGERGLLGLALHPDFPDDARAFVHYSDGDGHTVLSEFAVTETSNPIGVDPTTERVLLRVEQPFANHNGGQLAFGPDRYLWLGLGDGGSGGDPLGHGQNPATLLGSILRIDVDDIPDDGSDAIGYGIPDDNPFADGANGAPEVYLYGLRNPWRFSFDRETGALWIADVGQNALEEVSRVDPVADAGGNLGWNLMEASACYVAGCSPEGLILPVAEYGRDQGCSVTGGHVYRGGAVEGLAGWYLFSDYCSGLLFGIRSDAPGTVAGERAAAPRVLLETGANASTFGQDADGELYLADHDSGTIYRIVAGD